MKRAIQRMSLVLLLPLMVAPMAGQEVVEHHGASMPPGMDHHPGVEEIIAKRIPAATSMLGKRQSTTTGAVTIIESSSAGGGQNMDLKWEIIASGMGYSPMIYPQEALEDSALLDNTDFLVMSSGVIDIPQERADMILYYLRQGGPMYLQTEYNCELSTNLLFEALVDSLGGSFEHLGTAENHLLPMNVLGDLSMNFHQVTSLEEHYWWGCYGSGDTTTITPFLEFQESYFGHIFEPVNPAHGIIMNTSDQDWIRVLEEDAAVYLMENMLHYALGVVGIEDVIQPIVKGFDLYQNYPNPFNPSTDVEFGMRGAEWITLKIYDSTGRLVQTLLDAQMAAGRHTVQWDGINSAGQQVASGVYLYRMTAGEFTQTRRMLLMR